MRKSSAKKWRRCALLAALLALGVLGGCLPAPQPAPPGSYTPPASRSESASQPEEEEAPGEPAAFSILLPDNMSLFGERLTQLAAADGNTLTVRTAPAGAAYGQVVEIALENGGLPDIFWLEGEESLLTLSAEKELPLYDLESEAAGQLMNSLAEMVPSASRVTGHGGLAGLPLGYFAEGYLVNIELLAALLGSDRDTVLDDLYACNWSQWVRLVRALQSYLAQPGRIELRLGTKRYAMPSYRPGVAQPVRGIFAVPTADAEALTGNALDILTGLCYEDPATLLSAVNAEKLALMRPALASLMGVLELETMHMTQKNGPLRRGEDFGEQEAYTKAQAAELFTGGTAIFLRGDSRLGAKLELENPKLAGKLALVPVKLPPPAYLAGGESEAEAVTQALEGGGEAASGGEEETTGGEAVIPEAVVEEVINNSNLGLWFAADGLLCVNENTGALRAVESLLLRLYTTGEGQTLAEEELGLYTFTRTYPTGTLRQQVAAEVTDGGWQLVASPGSLELPKRGIGSYLQRSLLFLHEWTATERAGFLTTGLASLGISTTAVAPPPEADSADGSSGSQAD